MHGIALPENFNWPYAARNLQDFGDRDRSTLQLPGECGTLDEFHHQVTGNLRRGADVVERADIGMIQRGYHSGFAMEAVGELGQADFHRHLPA